MATNPNELFWNHMVEVEDYAAANEASALAAEERRDEAVAEQRQRTYDAVYKGKYALLSDALRESDDIASRS